MKLTKTKNNTRAMEIYNPSDLARRENTQLARRGNTDLARRGDYSIVPADEYDIDVVEGRVNLWRPEVVKQAEPKKERKPFDLLHSVKMIFAWTLVALAILGFLTFWTLPNPYATSYATMLWINGVVTKIAGVLILAVIFEGFLLGALSDLFGGSKSG